MLWYILTVLLCISLGLIALGLYRSEHTELSIIGFLFLFILSFSFSTGTIEYKIGSNTTYSYNGNSSSPYLTVTNDLYGTFDNGGTLGHIVGYYLAIASLIGFVAVLIGLRNSRLERGDY